MQTALAFIFAIFPCVLYSQRISDLPHGIDAEFTAPGGLTFTLRDITLTPTSRIPIFRATVETPANGGTDVTLVEVAAEIVCAGGTRNTLKFTAGLGNLKPGDNAAADPIVSAKGALDSDCHLTGVASVTFKSGIHVDQGTLDERERGRVALENKLTEKTANAELGWEMARRAAELEAAKVHELMAQCSDIYRRTSDKKMSDLTVVEDRAVRACDALGYYHR